MELQNTHNLSIVEYANYLYNLGGVNKVIDTLKSQFFEVRQMMKNSGIVMLKIKYMEHNKIWTKWGRQCRGVILRLDNKSNVFVCDKMMLIRGAEVLTNVHINANIKKTQDITDFKEKNYLDASQIDTIERLLNSYPIDAYMSFKNDGSLLAISLYPICLTDNQTFTNSASFYKNLIMSYGDDFSKSILNLSQEMNLPFIPIISTQGTLFLADDMKDYMVSAILIGTCNLTFEQVKNISLENTPIDALVKYGQKFFQKLKMFYELFFSSENSSMTLSFEAICKNRSGCWCNSKIHTELAISYNFTDLRFLGCVFNIGKSVGIYKAHYQISNECALCGFDEPLYWKINHANDVNNMMNNLTKVIFNEISESDYFKICPYDNKHIPKNVSIDYEGWIIYRTLEDGTLDYSKIKSEEYYISHIFREYNIPKLIEISKFKRNIFPLADFTHDFFFDLNKKFYNVFNKIKYVLDSYNKNIMTGLPPKAIISFKQQNYHTKIKMLINASNTWNKICFDIFFESFPMLKQNDETYSSLKSIVMSVKPWEECEMIKINIGNIITYTITPKNKNQIQMTNHIGNLFEQIVKCTVL